MSILKQNNKILKSISGEIYKEPLIIDIDSEYGVTKDGSNLVSAVKNRGNANQFIQETLSKRPIENGNGFEFNGNNNNLSGCGFKVDNLQMFETWVYFKNIKNNQQIFSNRTQGDNSDFISLVAYDVTFSGKDIQLAFGVNSSGSNKTINVVDNNIVPALNINTWLHILAVVSLDSVTTYVNGKLYRVYELGNISNTKIRNCVIGCTFNNQSVNFIKGNLATLKIKRGYIKSLDFYKEGWDASQYSVYQNTLFFTPPTYPNTIL